jgi:hypothetical protein
MAMWIQSEVIFKFVPQVFADLGPSAPCDEHAEQGRDEAVVLVRYKIGHTDRVPLIEEEPEIGLHSLQIHFAIVSLAGFPWKRVDQAASARFARELDPTLPR